MPDLHTAARKKLPKQLAAIDADYCTGCEACVEVCPVDCIRKIDLRADAPGLQGWCEIGWDRCIGCRLCIRVPSRKSRAYTLTVCPWDAIRMVPVEKIVEAVDHAGGPPPMAAGSRPRLAAMARRQVEALRGK